MSVSENANALTFEQFTLDNGMEVVVVPDHRVPVVMHSVWYQAGSVDEPAFREHKTGIAHMLEHMMFKGTDKMPPQEFSKVVARNGGQDNAFTSRDFTAYYQKVAVDRLPLMMEIEADRMGNLNINDEVFQPERDVVLEERRWRTDSKPTSRFFEKLVKVHYDGHPYENPVIGWRNDIEGYKVEDAIDWYDANYAPNKATMILVGDVDAKTVKPLVEKYYGGLKAVKKMPRETLPLPAFKEARVLKEVDKEVKVPVFYRLYRAPGLFVGVGDEAGNLAQATAAAVMADILGDDSTGKLYQVLVEEKKLADAASASYDPVGRGESTLDIFVQPKPGVTLAEIEKEVEAVIADFKKNGVTEEEFKRVAVAMKAQDVYAQDDPFNVMYRLGRFMMAGGAPDSFDAWIVELDKVTLADVMREAHAILVKEKSTTGYLVGEEKDLAAN